MPSVNAQEVLAEHARGDSLRTIGARHGVSHELVRRVVLREGSAVLRDLTTDLLTNGWTSILIPYGQQERDWRDAHIMLTWSVRNIRESGLEIEVRTRPTWEGVGFELRRTRS